MGLNLETVKVPVVPSLMAKPCESVVLDVICRVLSPVKFTTFAESPKLAAEATWRVPALMETPPLKVLLVPERTRLPAPFF